jgi:hypothetical protein
MEYFMSIWYILLHFGIFNGHLVHIFPVLACQENLATLPINIAIKLIIFFVLNHSIFQLHELIKTFNFICSLKIYLKSLNDCSCM